MNTGPDPNIWFAVLRAAIEAGDRQLAAMARTELAAAGYRVRVSRQPKQHEAGRQ